jgi:hypothetical protein
MTAAISAMEMSCRIREADGTSTTTSGAATPWIVARVTPASNRRATNSSANRPSCSGATGPVMTTSVTRSHHAPRRTVGVSASSGRSVTLSMATCTSSAARDMSQPGSNSISMDARPSRLVAEVAATPGTATSTGSSTATMAASTSSAPAPSQRTSMSISSEITSGKNCARICGKAVSPAASIRTSSRFAAVRCRVK